MVLKTCNWCKQDKYLSEFGPRKDSKDGLQQQCRVCRGQTQAEYRKARYGS
jgi:hypothetical protein